MVDDSDPLKQTSTELGSIPPRSKSKHVWELLYSHRGLLALGVALILLNRMVSLVVPASSKYWIDRVVIPHDEGWLVPLLIGCVSAVIVQAGTAFAFKELFDRAATRLTHAIQSKLQIHLGRLPLSFHDHSSAGALTSRVMDEVAAVEALVSPGPADLVGGLISCALAFLVMVRIDRGLALLCLAFVAGLILLGYYFVIWISPIYHKRCEANAEITGRLTQSLNATRTIKTYQAENREAAVFARGLERILKLTYRVIHGGSALEASCLILIGGTSSLVMFIGARHVLAGTMTVGDLVCFSLFQLYLVLPAHGLVLMVPKFSRAFVGLDRVREILSVQPEDRDRKRNHVLRSARGDIVFDDVGFGYQRGQPRLQHISFEAKRGTTTALVGSSGSGKSTIVNLISTFYSPTSGKIYIDGVDLSTIRLDSYRSYLAVVTQDIFLFDDSIRQNILFSRPSASEREFERACRIACVDEFAKQLKDGYDTIIGERGIRLSGGQRQRLSIARALLADPRILILDEATSNMDSESENLIRRALSATIQGRTTFIIAHRLSTVRSANQILVVEKGEIIERGNHEELISRAGRYHQLSMSQSKFESDRLTHIDGYAVEL